MANDYSKNDIQDALIKVGIQKGDCVLVHSNLGFFGKLESAKSSTEYCNAFFESIMEIIGANGTLIVPTFTYSLCWNQIFDVENTKTSDCGMFAEFVRNIPETIRSKDGIHSVAAIGTDAKFLTEKAPEHSFGKNSFWERFLNKNGKICRFNLNADFNTFIHYVEKELDVSYRFDKKFTGTMIVNNKKIQKTNYHFVRDLDDANTIPDLSKLENTMEKMNMVKKINLGKGQIICMYAKDVFQTIKNEIQKEPNFLTKGKINTKRFN